MTNTAQEEYDQICEDLLQKIDDIQKANQLLGKPNRQINENDIAKSIIKACDVIHIDLSVRQNKKDYTFGIYDPFSMGYVRDTNFITQLVHHIIDNVHPAPNLSISSVTRAVSVYLMAKSNRIRFANIPPNYLVKFKNKIINLQTKQLFDFNDEEMKDYDFIETLPHNILTEDELNQEMKQRVDQVFNIWSNEDSDQLKTIMQLFYAFLDKNGRGLQIILQSDGGDGKSTAMRLISSMGNEESTIYMNVDQYTDDNIMNKVQPSTRFVMGDDMPSNFKMNSKGLSRFKTFIDGGFLNVGEKYMPNKLISFRGLKIQATNTDLKFYENNDAVSDRILYIEWPHHNFRQHPITEFDLDELSGKYSLPNKDFMEALISKIAFNVEHFEKFHITDQMKEKTQATLNANDSILQHVNEMQEQSMLDYPLLPINIAYEHYKQWLKETNPGSSPVKKIDYSKRLRKILISEDWGYEEGPRKILKSLNSDEFDLSILGNLYYDDEKRSMTLQNTSLQINNKIVETFKEDILLNDLDEISKQYSNKRVNQIINYIKNNDPNLLLNISLKLDIKSYEVANYDKTLIIQAIEEILMEK